MRILILGSNSDLYCGWTSMSKGLSEGFSLSKIENLVVEGINPKYNFNNPLHLSHHIQGNFQSLLFDTLRIFFYSIFYRPKHIIIVPEPLCKPTFIVSKILNIKYSIYSAGTYSSLLLEKKGVFSKSAFVNATNIFTMSEYTKKRIISKFNSNKICTVFSGYNSKEYYQRNIKKERYSIIFVGNLKRRKGFQILCESIFSLPKDIKEKIFLRLVGVFNKQEFYKFHKLLKLNKVSYKIYTNINDNDLSILFNKSVVNVLPSRTEEYYYEGFGIIHSESIASNCITIGSLNSGNESAILENNGYLINQGEKAIEELTNILKFILISKNVMLPKGKRPLKWNDVTNKILLNLK